MPAAFAIEAATRGAVPVACWLGTDMGKAHWARLNLARRKMGMEGPQL